MMKSNEMMGGGMGMLGQSAGILGDHWKKLFLCH